MITTTISLLDRPCSHILHNITSSECHIIRIDVLNVLLMSLMFSKETWYLVHQEKVLSQAISITERKRHSDRGRESGNRDEMRWERERERKKERERERESARSRERETCICVWVWVSEEQHTHIYIYIYIYIYIHTHINIHIYIYIYIYIPWPRYLQIQEFD